jgi:hypothetical protein
VPNWSVNLASKEEAEKLQSFIVTGLLVTTSGRLGLGWLAAPLQQHSERPRETRQSPCVSSDVYGGLMLMITQWSMLCKPENHLQRQSQDRHKEYAPEPDRADMKSGVAAD